MKLILTFILLSIIIISCNNDEDPFILEGQQCLTGTWIGAGCPESIGYDTLNISENQVFITSADCGDACEGNIPLIIRNFDIADITNQLITLEPSGGIICGSPAPIFGDPIQVEYECLEDNLQWNGITFQRIVDTPPCFEGIWAFDRCQDARYGKDILDINPLKQVTMTLADCGNNCPTNTPRSVQIYSIAEYSNDRFLLQILSSTQCADPIEFSQNLLPVGYECKGDTLFWGGTPYILQSRYRQ